METNLLTDALLFFSAAFVLAGMTQAVHLRRDRKAARENQAGARRRQSSYTGGNILKVRPIQRKDCLRVIRLPINDREKFVIGVIAPGHMRCGMQPMPGRGSGPPPDAN